MWFHCPVQADWMMPFDPHATHPGPARVLHVGFVTGRLFLLLTLAACGLERDPDSGADISSTPHYHVDAQTRSAEPTSELHSLMRNSYSFFCLTTKNKTIHTAIR